MPTNNRIPAARKFNFEGFTIEWDKQQNETASRFQLGRGHRRLSAQPPSSAGRKCVGLPSFSQDLEGIPFYWLFNDWLVPPCRCCRSCWWRHSPGVLEGMLEVGPDFDSWPFRSPPVAASSGGTDEWCSKLEFVVIVHNSGRRLGGLWGISVFEQQQIEKPR